MFSSLANNSLIRNAAFCKESFVHLSDTNMSVQRFQNRLVHEFCGLKASQMSKICASSREYPYVEKKNQESFVNRISNMRQTTSNWIVRILDKVTIEIFIPLLVKVSMK